MNDLATRKALAQKYLDEYAIEDDYVSVHDDSDYMWLAIADDTIAFQGAAAVVRSVNDASRWLALVVRDSREPIVAVDLRTDTQYTPHVEVNVHLTKANYS